MYIGIPQLVYLFLLAAEIGISLAKDGQPKTGKTCFVATLIAVALQCSLLWWGGFFAGGN